MADHASALQQDADARVAALAATRSLLLQAPAGSGKTTVLTARFLTLLSVVDAPEQILAITFTRKAAAEMRQRIVEALHGEGESTAPGLDPELLRRVRERDRERGWELHDNPARLQVQTIDALNNRLARMLPVAARAAPGLTLARHAADLYRRAAVRALEAAWLEPTSRQAAALLFERMDNNWRRLELLLSDMLAHRSHWLPRILAAGAADLAERVHTSLQSLIEGELSVARQAIPEPLRVEGQALLAHVARLRRLDAPSLSASAADLPHWRALCALALTKTGWRRSLTIAQGFERQEGAMKQRALDWIERLAREELEPTLRAVAALPELRLGAAEEQALTALAQLLVRAALELQLIFAESGRVDYAHIAGAARASLTEEGQPSDLALRLGLSLRHILVDEFQDTSYEQFGLLQALTAGWEAHEGRTLFLVGDPMQSIYQFREAEVGLFLRARDLGVGALRLQALALRCNFRTQRPLLDWINERFARLFPRRDDARCAAVAYLPSIAARHERDRPAWADAAPVGMHRFEADDRPGEAQRVLQIVQAARLRDAECSIAILVANRQHATRIAAVLREAGVSLRGVDLEPLGERAVIRDLAALTRALQHRADRTAWLALLRAPWCGLTLGELEAFAAQAQVDHFAAIEAWADAEPDTTLLCAERRLGLQRLAQALRPALTGSERALCLWQRVEHCWLRLAGPAIHDREADRLDAQRFLDTLALHEDPDTLVGEQLNARLLESLYSAEPVQPGAVQIMTMHAAKGLEWDVVILPGLGRCPAVDTDPLLHWLELPRPDGGTELLLSPIRDGVGEPAHSLARFIKSLRRERLRLERVRLLYVAATRARRQLHLLGSLRESAQGTPRPPTGSPLHFLWPALGEEFAALPASVPAGPVGEGAGTPALQRVDGGWRMPEAPRVPRPQRLSLPAGSAGAVPEYLWVGLTARAIGTIVHAELHRLSLQRPLPQTPEERSRPGHYAQWLADLGVPESARARAQGRIVEALARTLADPRGRWLLSDQHREAHSEWRLTGLHAGRVTNVVFDRMLVDAEGQRWIIDFKTSSHEGGSVDRFLDAEIERHALQLQRYGALASALGPEPLRLALYFPLLGAFRELAARRADAAIVP